MGKEDPARDLDWTSAAKMRPEACTVEMRIPWKTLEAVGIRRDNLVLALDNVGPQRFGDRGLERWLRPIAYWLTLEPRIRGERLLISTKPAPEKRYTVRLHFAEIAGAKAGERVFDVKVQGKAGLTRRSVKSGRPRQ